MYEIWHDSGPGDEVFTTVQKSDVEAFRPGRPGGSFTVTIGNTDIPAYVSNGVLYLQAPLGLFFEAFAENLSDFLRDMEIRISDSRGTAFSLDSHGHPVSLAGLAEPRMVRNRRWRR